MQLIVIMSIINVCYSMIFFSVVGDDGLSRHVSSDD